MSSYCFHKTVSMTVAEAEEKVRERLADAGFGILTEIDVQGTMKKKLDVDIEFYKILGACNPHFAHQALQVEPRIGTMLPCNVIVRKTTDGSTEVTAVDPMASMQAVVNPGLADIAIQVRSLLQKVISGL